MRKCGGVLSLVVVAFFLFCHQAMAALGKGEVIIGEIDSSRFPILMTTLSILDPSGRPVTDLDAKALRVSVDGKELQGLSRVAKGEEAFFQLAKTDPEAAPIFLVLAIDVSGSMKGAPFQDAREAAEKVLSGLTPVDRAALITFGAKVERHEGLTANYEAIRTRLARLTPTRRETVLYDALCDAVNVLSVIPSGRKAVVVLSDGKDEGSRVRPEDCIQRASQNRVAIFSLIVGPPAAQRTARTGLGRISTLSGGIDFYRDGSPSVKEAPSIILRELKSQYLLSFTHPRIRQDGREHQLIVEIRPWSFSVGEARATVGFIVPSRPGDRTPLGITAVLVILLLALAAGGTIWLRRPRRRELLPPIEELEPMASPAPFFPRAPQPTDPVVQLGGVGRTAALADEPHSRESAGPAGGKTELVAAPPLTLSWFVEKEGMNPGQIYRVTSESFVIGRSPQADLSLSDETVSDKHARLRKEADRFIIYDLASTNGLFVNGERVYSRALRDGDEVKVGNTVLVFKEILEGPPTS